MPIPLYVRIIICVLSIVVTAIAIASLNRLSVFADIFLERYSAKTVKITKKITKIKWVGVNSPAIWSRVKLSYGSFIDSNDVICFDL